MSFCVEKTYVKSCSTTLAGLNRISTDFCEDLAQSATVSTSDDLT